MGGGFGLRLLFALALVGVTYSPSRFSFYHWVARDFPGIGPEQAVAGIVLLIGCVIYVRATLRSLGAVGIALAIALLLAGIWVLVARGVTSQ